MRSPRPLLPLALFPVAPLALVMLGATANCSVHVTTGIASGPEEGGAFFEAGAPVSGDATTDDGGPDADDASSVIGPCPGAPTPLAIGANGGSSSAATVYQSADRGSCSLAGAGTAPTAVFALEVAQSGTYVLSVSTTYLGQSSASTTSVFVRKTCENPSSELACDLGGFVSDTDAGAAGTQLTLGTGTYALFIQGGLVQNPFTVSLTPTTGCPSDSACPTSLPRCDASGVCTAPLVCTPPLADCDDLISNGCETDTATDPSDCGGCGKACGAQAFNTVATCANSTCSYACAAGAHDCSGGTSGTGCTCAPGSQAPSASCSGTQCVLACNPGWGDCNDDPNDGCEHSTTWDDANCGGCGVVCGNGASCTDGRCLAATTSIAPSEPNGVAAIAVDASQIYWLVSSSSTVAGGCDAAVRFAPLAGGPTTTIASGLCAASGLALDTASVYVTAVVGSTGAILGFPKGSGDAGAGSEVVAYPAGVRPDGLALVGGTFFMSGVAATGSQTTYGLWSATAGTTPVSLGTLASPVPAFAITATDVVFLDGFPGAPISVNEVPLAGGTPTLLGTTTHAQGVASLAGDIYLTDSGQVTVLGAGGTKTSVALPTGIDGGSIVASGSDLYFSTIATSAQPGMVAVMAGGAGSFTALAGTVGPPPEGGAIQQSGVPLAVGAGFVYFADGAGIHRAPL